MDNYQLKEDEVVLYKGPITINKFKGSVELLLTNYNFVFISKKKGFMKDLEINVETYPTNEVKIYENKPQIITKGTDIIIYFFKAEKEFHIASKSELHKFMDASLKLITGKNKMERGLTKIKTTIEQVDNSLGINSVETTKNLAKNGVINTALGGVAKIGKSIIGKKK